MAALLEVRGLCKSFGSGPAARRVLDGVDFTVGDGEFLAIVGESGAGKSTLLAMLAGLLRPDAGTIELAGRPLDGPGRDRGVVFQHYSLLPWLTARQNVRLAVDQAFRAEPAAEREARVQRLLELVHLGPARDKLPRQLSGGMKQRVAVARALATEPRVLLLDEPFSALDALTRASLQEELERIHAADGKTVVMITNDADEALLLADRVVVLTAAGRLLPATSVDLPRPRAQLGLAEAHRYRALRDELTRRLRHQESEAEEAGPGAGGPAAGPGAERAAGGPLLELCGVGKVFATPDGPQAAVRDVQLALGRSEFVSLIGHSGCGKTTVLSMIAGLTRPTSGTIRIDGQPVTGPGSDRALVFQAASLLPWLDAEENVRLGVDQAYPESTRAERRRIAEQALERVGLLAERRRRPADLSAGMRQRIGVARAFALAPRLLLLDEPFGSLDSVTRAELRAVLSELWARTRIAALLVTHDVDEALLLSDRIAMMTDGPAATIGEVFEVDLPRPRRIEELVDHPAYLLLRRRVLDGLARTSMRRDRRAEGLPQLAGAPVAVGK